MPDHPKPDDSKPNGRVIPIGEPWRLHLTRGLEALRRGDTHGAEEHLRRAWELAPEHPDVMLALARALRSRGALDEAVALLEVVVGAQPQRLAPAALLARTLGLDLGQRVRAFELLHRSLEFHPEGAELHVLRGELLLEDNNIEAARGAFAAALALENASELVHSTAQAGLARCENAEGIMLSEDGDSERAIFAFKRSADLDPAWSAPLVNLGVVFERLERLPRAVEAFQDALLRDAENPVAMFNLGSVTHQLGDLDRALEAYEGLYQLVPDYPGLRVALANVLGDRRDFDNAIALLLEELEISPDAVGAWNSLGLAYTCAGNTARGEECLHEALARDPESFDAMHNLAVIYTSQARLDDARAMLRRALTLDDQRTRTLLREDESLAPLRALVEL